MLRVLLTSFKPVNNLICCKTGLMHSCPQSPSFLGHVVGKRGALEAAVIGCQNISDIRSGMCKSYKINITAHAHNGFLSLNAPLGEKFYFPSSLQRVVSFMFFGVF